MSNVRDPSNLPCDQVMSSVGGGAQHRDSFWWCLHPALYMTPYLFNPECSFRIVGGYAKNVMFRRRRNTHLWTAACRPAENIWYSNQRTVQQSFLMWIVTICLQSTAFLSVYMSGTVEYCPCGKGLWQPIQTSAIFYHCITNTCLWIHVPCAPVPGDWTEISNFLH